MLFRSKTDIKESLKRFGAAHYVRARETGHVLYLEGSTDLAILRAFADRLNHPVRDLIADGAHLNVYLDYAASSAQACSG